MTGAFVVFATVAACVSAVRWLRVAQREHYLPWTVSLFARRWWLIDRLNTALFAVAGVAAGLAMAGVEPLLAGSVAIVVAAVGPWGLSLRGVSSPLAWTSRMRRLAFVSAGLWALAVAITGWVWSVAGDRAIGILAYELLALPLLVDLGLAIVWPAEQRSQQEWIDQAQQRIDSVTPTVIGITGSYGKTTTKNYLLALLARQAPTVATPASFNNRMGLARSINEHLSDGTDYFIAEMGTYGPGEIADMVDWVVPKVAVMTAIGPVHLERFGTLEEVVRAKSEIFAPAEAVVLNIDDPYLATLADRVTDLRVVRVSATGDDSADVSLIESGEVIVAKAAGADFVLPRLPLVSNLACALGVLVALELPLDGADEALAGVSTPDHRQTVFTSDSGLVIVDDTYNSNPAGAEAALRRLAGEGTGRRVVVTPGMVELGPEQHAANVEFARACGEVADVLVAVARTNRPALLEGAAMTGMEVIVVAARQDAVEWVRGNLVPGDAVLYENDLPDHHP